MSTSQRKSTFLAKYSYQLLEMWLPRYLNLLIARYFDLNTTFMNYEVYSLFCWIYRHECFFFLSNAWRIPNVQHGEKELLLNSHWQLIQVKTSRERDVRTSRWKGISLRVQERAGWTRVHDQSSCGGDSEPIGQIALRTDGMSRRLVRTMRRGWSEHGKWVRVRGVTGLASIGQQRNRRGCEKKWEARKRRAARWDEERQWGEPRTDKIGRSYMYHRTAGSQRFR